jgi:hypothetical protein
MPQTCAIETCKLKSRALCHCCSKNLCLDHLKEHKDLPNSQLNIFVDEINTVGDQVSALNIDTVIENHRQKLDKWRDDCYTVINHLYEEKCQELQQRCAERINKHRREIDQIRTKINELIHEQEATHEDIPLLRATINDVTRDVTQLAEKGIIVDIHPLIIDKNIVYIEEWTSKELKISTLPSPFRKVDCSDEDWPVTTSNSRFLLLDQHPNLCLFDRELTLVKQCPWNYARITDMCWSSTLNSFIMITNIDGVFIFNENLTSFEPIQMIEKKQWLSCTCSDAVLFITTNGRGSDIFEFNLLSSFNLIKQWSAPRSCDINESIHSIAYNNGTLVLLFKDYLNNTLHVELRSSTTFDRLWSFPFDITNTGGRITRICLLKNDEWLVTDYRTSSLLQISKDGKLKFTHKYTPTPQNAVLFGSNILAIRTTNCVDFYRV